jgi:hypothetical protein
MTPSEFLYHLKKLPADTPMTATHVAAILETFSPLLQHKPQTDFDSLPNAKLIDEDTLAEWLGESPSSLQKWRLKGGGPSFVKGPKSVRYSVGAVRDWIASRTVTSTSEAHVKGLSKFETDQQRDETSWSLPYPVMLMNDRFTGFFRSVEHDQETEPEGFHMVRLPTSLPSELETTAAPLLEMLYGFRYMVVGEPKHARTAYEEWEGRLTNAQRFGLFETALPFDLDFARHIGNRLPPDFIAIHFHPAAWLWQVLVEYEERLLYRENLMYAFDYLASMGSDINRSSQIVDRTGKEIFTGTIAHLLADTTGESFHADSLPEDLQYYSSLLTTLLDLGLDVGQSNKPSGGKTVSEIADAIDRQQGIGSSLFNTVLNRYRLYKKIANNLPKKETISPASQENDGKI